MRQARCCLQPNNRCPTDLTLLPIFLCSCDGGNLHLCLGRCDCLLLSGLLPLCCCFPIDAHLHT